MATLVNTAPEPVFFIDATVMQPVLRSLGVRQLYTLYLHEDKMAALKHAALLQSMTGDYCRVKKYGNNFRVVRFDASGKEVSFP